MGGRSAVTAPFHIPGARTPPGSFGPPDQAPSLGWGGMGLQDPRLPYNSANSQTGAGIIGFYGSGMVRTLAAAPASTQAQSLNSGQAAAAGVPITIGALTSGTTLLTSPFLCFPSLNYIPVGAAVWDGVPGYVPFGKTPSSFRTMFYDPSTLAARCPVIGSSPSATGGVFIVTGADIYGYTVTQQITAVTNSVVAGLKPLKFIISIVPQFTDAGNTYTAGNNAVFGLPMFINQKTDVIMNYNNAAQFNPVLPTQTAPTLTSADVRGTISLSAPSTIKVIEMWQSVPIEAAGPNGLFPGNLVNAMFGFPQT
jgi:hypothetical protein